MSEPLIRPIRAEDDAAVAAIIRDVMSSLGVTGRGSSIEDAEVDAMYAAYAGPRAAYVVVEDGGRVLRQLLAAARARGYRRCYLETRAGMDAAQKLYVKTGFKALSAPIGATGHSACDRHYLLDL